MVFNSVRVGFFLAVRDIRRNNIYANLLIILVMTLTFVNLIFSKGILTGLPAGATETYEKQYSSDILITKLDDKTHIIKDDRVIDIVNKTEGIKEYTTRYVVPGEIVSDYKQKPGKNDKPNSIRVEIAGIDPETEDSITELQDRLAAGRYLNNNDTKGVLLGASLLEEYTNTDGIGDTLLSNTDVGTTIEIEVNGQKEKYEVIGILESKVRQVDRRAFMLDKSLKSLVGRDEFFIDEIAIEVEENVNPVVIKYALLRFGIDEYAKVQTTEESRPSFITDIQGTFSILGNIIGGVGLIVSSITIFIVIFVNAITRRKYIGILKGIGISNFSIEISYVFQSIFYASIGAIIGSIIIHQLLVPYFLANPINFPFADGILIAPYRETSTRAVVLMIATIIAGYLPAKIIVRQNTLDAILGR